MEFTNRLVFPDARAFGAGARRTTAGAAVLPGNSTAWLRLSRGGETGFSSISRMPPSRSPASASVCVCPLERTSGIFGLIGQREKISNKNPP
jgi:hypothetical protein